MTVTNEQFEALRTDVQNLSVEMKSNFKEWGEIINSLATTMDRRFERVDQRFDKMDQRFEQIDQRFDRLDLKVDRLDTSVNRMRKSIKAMRTDFFNRCDVISEEVKITDRHSRNVEDRVIDLENRVDLLEEKHST